MRSLVRQPTRLVASSGRILVGTIIIKPSGSGVRRPPRRTKVTRRWSLDPITWSARPSSLVSSSGAGLYDSDRGAAFGQVISGGQAGDAAADDDGVRHGQDR